MPFTLSHPAAVLPLMRVGLVPSALVIGSMAPDLPYFLQMGTNAGLTHSPLGVVTVDLLMGIAGLLLWHLALAPTAVAFAPTGVRQRLAPQLPVAPRTFLASRRSIGLAGISLVVGASTHVLWDEFTHPGRWGERHIGWLATGHAGQAGTTWAQYASGVFGLSVLSLWAWGWWRRTPAADARTGPQRIPAASREAAIAALAAVLALTAVAGLISTATTLAGGHGVTSALFHGATWGGGAGLLAALGVTGLHRLVARSEDQP